LLYLCGFQGSAGVLIEAGGRAFLVVDGRYVMAAQRDAADGRIGPVEVVGVARRYDESLVEFLVQSGVTEVGFEAEQVSVSRLRRWQCAAPALNWSPMEGMVEAQRAVKDAAEIAVLRRAGRELAYIASRLGDWVAEGRTEREVARAIDNAIERAGFSEPAFPTIVASGPNSAHPHARPTDRRIARGDLVVLDFGGRLDGYCGDLTRMAAVGEVGTDARALFDAVRDAQAAALSAVRAGVLTSTVDAAARQVLETRGLGEAFLHATGHGLGLDVHEAPRLARDESDSASRLQAGMVCTIEPGAYVEGLGGVRLEDDVLVTKEGCDVLTEGPRDLLIV
jgi:Xaa-Pro aminopeptidase